MDQTYNNIQQTVTVWIMRKWNAYEMHTEYSVLRYKTVARTGGFAAYTHIHTKEAIHHLLTQLKQELTM